mmetsp:Transcript_9507/g.31051  ORF Transcript_9507/g.31051 Transcript_9507/m.31051 type:complete len:236 (+) Transcript_9507:1187-1894(+)
MHPRRVRERRRRLEPANDVSARLRRRGRRRAALPRVDGRRPGPPGRRGRRQVRRRRRRVRPVPGRPRGEDRGVLRSRLLSFRPLRLPRGHLDLAGSILVRPLPRPGQGTRHRRHRRHRPLPRNFKRRRLLAGGPPQARRRRQDPRNHRRPHRRRRRLRNHPLRHGARSSQADFGGRHRRDLLRRHLPRTLPSRRRRLPRPPGRAHPTPRRRRRLRRLHARIQERRSTMEDHHLEV